jgi:ElaB/YqjD/DUF883 family membrane-anchored ribosome-binding protein
MKMTRLMEAPIGSPEKVNGGEVRDDVAALRTDVEKLVADMARIARQEVHAGVNSSAEIKSAMEKQAAELFDHARDYVRDNPLGACAIAGAAGFAVALLLKR